MPEPIKTPEETRKARARKIVARVHPDRIQSNVAEHLIEPLDWIIKRPEVPDNWGQDLNQRFKRGTEITLVGNSKEGVLRDPKKIIVRKPSDFLDILETYLDTGDIPKELEGTPEYDPASAPPIMGLAPEMSEEDDYGDDADSARGQATAAYEAQEAEHSLITAVRNATDYDYCVGLRVATRMYAQVTMRARGVLQALDERVENFLAEEIKAADTSEKLQQVSERIKEFDFDDETARPRLEQTLAEHTAQKASEEPVLPEEPVYPPAHELEIRGSEARTLDELAETIKAIRIGAFSSTHVRDRTLKSTNSYARKIVVEECGHSASIGALRQIYEKVQRFPFTDTEYGYRILGLVEMHAKYLLFGQMLASRQQEDVEAIAQSAKEFPFWSAESKAFIATEAERRKQVLRDARSR